MGWCYFKNALLCSGFDAAFGKLAINDMFGSTEVTDHYGLHIRWNGTLWTGKVQITDLIKASAKQCDVFLVKNT